MNLRTLTPIYGYSCMKPTFAEHSIDHKYLCNVQTMIAMHADTSVFINNDRMILFESQVTIDWGRIIWGNLGYYAPGVPIIIIQTSARTRYGVVCRSICLESNCLCNGTLDIPYLAVDSYKQLIKFGNCVRIPLEKASHLQTEIIQRDRFCNGGSTLRFKKILANFED